MIRARRSTVASEPAALRFFPDTLSSITTDMREPISQRATVDERHEPVEDRPVHRCSPSSPPVRTCQAEGGKVVFPPNMMEFCPPDPDSEVPKQAGALRILRSHDKCRRVLAVSDHGTTPTCSLLSPGPSCRRTAQRPHSLLRRACGPEPSSTNGGAESANPHRPSRSQRTSKITCFEFAVPDASAARCASRRVPASGRHPRSRIAHTRA